MRMLPAAVLLAATLSGALPAIAQETLAERVGDAYRTFNGNLDLSALAEGGYFDAVTAGIDGNWVFASGLVGQNGDVSTLDEKISDICTAEGPGRIRIAVSGPMSIALSRVGTESYTATLVYRGGLMFASQIDTTEYLTYFGLIDRENMEQAKLNALMGSTAPVMIFRPADDVFVIARTHGYAEVYARCPGPGATTVDTAALEAALGKAFDGQFPKATKPEVRAAFISCAVGPSRHSRHRTSSSRSTQTSIRRQRIRRGSKLHIQRSTKPRAHAWRQPRPRSAARPRSTIAGRAHRI
jgi:hypothetical protein